MRSLLPLVLLASLGCGGGSPAPGDSPAPATAPPKATARPTASQRPAPAPQAEPTPQPAPEPQPEPPPPAKKERPTFKSDWLAAQDLLDARAAQRVKEAEGAKKLLVRAELREIEATLRTLERNPAGMNSVVAAKLNRLGFGESVRYFSSQAAREDKLFLEMIAAVWVPGFGSERLADIAERWLQVERSARDHAARAITNNVPTDRLMTTTRDTILALGLKDWLAR